MVKIEWWAILALWEEIKMIFTLMFSVVSAALVTYGITFNSIIFGISGMALMHGVVIKVVYEDCKGL